MKRITYILFFLCCLTGNITNAQTYPELVKLGDEAMQTGQYSNAVYYYAFTLYKIDQGLEAGYYPYEISTTYEAPHTDNTGAIVPPVNPTEKQIKVIHRLGKAYLLADDYENAEKWLAAAIKYPQEEFPNARFDYADALMQRGDYQAAEQEFTTFSNELTDSLSLFHDKARTKIASCQFARNQAVPDQRIIVEQLEGKMTEGSTNFGIQFTSDSHIIFSSARDKSNSDSTQKKDENFLLDLFIAPVNNGQIGTPEKFPFPLNSNEFHEASPTMSDDGEFIYFTKMNPVNKNETQIFGSRKIAGKWIEPFKLGSHVNKEGFRSLTPYFQSSNRRLYFSSNQIGGYGGLDLWYVEVKENGDITEPVNLGSSVNSTEDEISPYFQDHLKLLFYASSGHIGYGGMDIFYNVWDQNTDDFGPMKNLGQPVNSPSDETAFIIDDSYINGYVSSNRAVCTTCDSIYSLRAQCNQIYAVKLPGLKFKISGYVYDKKTNNPIPNARIEFKDITYEWPHFEITSDENGYYEQDLIPNLEAFLRASKIDYFADKALISTLGEIESKNFEQDFYLDRIPDKEITIEGIEYDFDSANLRPESEIVLDKLIEFLELNHNIIVEIRSHTDIRGDDDYNMRLSHRRAKSVVDYLVKHGIPLERLVPKGYGETTPAEITDDQGNTTIMSPEYIESLPNRKAKEEAHQRNRRTTFFVLEQN